MMITIEAGKSKGKKITLKKDEYTLGSARKSNIRLHGEFVSSEHAVLKLRDEDQWVLTNRSSNQTLVNDQIIDTKPLVVGDRIQVGATNLLKFDVVPTKAKKVKTSSDGKSQFANVVGEYLKKPAVIVALVFYIIVLFVIFTFLGGQDREGNIDGWNRLEIDAVIEKSTSYLLERSNFVRAPIEDENSSLTVDQIYKAARKMQGYDSIVWLHQSADAEADGPLSEAVSDLMAQVQDKLLQIWHLEQQGRWSEVVDGYEEVSAMIPDINLPITRSVIERQRWAGKKENE